MVSSFRDLVVWQEAYKLVLMIYKATATFPTGEQFGLTSQMRRAAASIPEKLVEGFKRRSHQDKIHFYNIAEASLEELYSNQNETRHLTSPPALPNLA